MVTRVDEVSRVDEVTRVDGQVYCSFHRMIQCYRQVLRIAIMICSNSLHLVTSLRIALVTGRSYP